LPILINQKKMIHNKENGQIMQITGSPFKVLQKLIIAGIFLGILSKSVQAQYNIDSIKGLSYEQFEEYFRKSHVDSVNDLLYATTFLEKAKKDADTVRIADAYLHLSYVSNYQIALFYADSIIQFTEKFQKHKHYPAKGYFSKGRIYYYLNKLQMAVDQYVIAHNYAKQSENNILLAKIKANIGTIKNRLGEKEEALVIFKDFITFVEKSEIPTKNILLANGMLALAGAYISTMKYDTANIIIQKGFSICKKNNYPDIYASLLSLYGVNLYYTKNYKASIDSISKAIKVYDLKNNTAFAYLFIGKSSLALGDTSIALKHFLSVDTFLCNNNFVMEELLEAYAPIIEYYKKKKDYSKQLFYTNQLLRFDSIFYTTKTTATKDINKKYEIPLLVESKEELIDKLKKDRKLFSRNIFILLIFSFMLITLISFLIIRNRTYKNRFIKLLKQIDEKDMSKNIDESKQYLLTSETENTISILDSELINSLLDKLEVFEKSKRFINRSYTLSNLAKEFKTNSTYLSKIINDYKKLSFSNYLKNLRIDFAITRLKNDAKFRTFTIQAIAEEVGFNKAQSFSTAFHKKTGLYPSYFIKQLEKQKIKINS
jgi:AraC-like DNA-binding protein